MRQETEWRNLPKLCLLNINAEYFKEGSGKRKKTQNPKKTPLQSGFVPFPPYFLCLRPTWAYVTSDFYKVMCILQSEADQYQSSERTESQSRKSNSSLNLEQLKQIKTRIKEYLYFLHKRDCKIQ